MNSRSKGKRGELELALLMRECGYANARRSAQYCGKTGDAPDIVGVEGLHIECKRVEQFSDETALRQAERDARKGNLPVVMYRRNNEDWKVCTRLDMFLLIWSELTDLQKRNIEDKIKFMRNKDKIGK